MIDYTKFPLGLQVNTDRENDRWSVKNTKEKDLKVTVLVKPGYWLTLPFGLLAEDEKSKVTVEVEE